VTPADITPRAIVDFRIGHPDDWVGLPLGGVTSLRDWADEAAGTVTETAAARRRASVQLHDMTVEMARETPIVAAAWVPDPQGGDVAAVMRAVLIADDGPVTLERYRALIEPDPRSGVKVLGERDISELDLVAGRTLLVREQVARGRLFPQVEEHLIYTVFPSGCDEAVDITFSSPYLALGPRLSEDAELMMGSLEIDVGDRVEP
jgi:hypothetical protein